MKFVADLHLHSHFSRATSKELDFEHLARWAQLKGVHVVGTGDIAHPGWLQEMRDKLEPAEEGLFRLKNEYARAVQSQVPPACQGLVRFMLAGEISSIYKKNDRVRKVHNVIFAPSLEAVEKIQVALEKIGNIRSDGRPILGLPSRDLLEIILEIDPACYLIPAHIWTPWFSLLGSKSGYDSVEECFDDLTPHIFALETGLSSDPPMNWRISTLDRYTLVSNSDAHSPQKLAREANVFDTELSYPAIFASLKQQDEGFSGTVEFFPEEGKYHYDGHRKCGICWAPKTTLAHRGICPVCGKKVTVGVMHRVEILADRPEGAAPAHPRPFRSLIPLPEVLAEVYGVGPASKQVQQSYETLLAGLGPELAILQDAPLDELGRVGDPLLAESLRRMRCGEVNAAGGYDGEYGVVKLFEAGERAAFSAQLSLLPGHSELEADFQDSIPSRPEAAHLHLHAQVQVSRDAAKSRSPGKPAPFDTLSTSFRATQGADQLMSSTKNEYTPSPEQAEPEPDEAKPAPAAWQQADLFGQAPAADRAVTADETLLAGLNPPQQAAARCIDASLVIVAGPGTGKTRTLTYRIAYLISSRGVAPENILAITFTNKAAAEMTTRLAALLGPELAGRLVVKTFHAFGAMLLREAGDRIGLDPLFAIAADQERRAVLKQLYPDLNDRQLDHYLEQISTAKNRLLAPDALEPGVDDPAGPSLAEVYRRYEAALRANQLLDVDDLILQPVRLLETAPDVLQAYRQRFRWISVDEYQDVNLAQYQLLRLLAAPETNLCVIGDPDQAIYGFRGANREYFLKFQEDFPAAKILPLSQNYRSTQLILDASRQVIARDAATARVDIWSELVDRTKVKLYQAPTGKAEAEYVVHEIEKMVGGVSYFSIDSGRVEDEEAAAGRSFADFAVLYRLGAQSQPLVEAFERSGIPYQTVGQTQLVEYKEVRTILACLRFLYNPKIPFHLEQAVPKKQLQPVTSFLAAIKDSVVTPVPVLIEQIQQFLAERSIFLLDEKSGERLQQLRRRAIPFENRLGEFLESMFLQKETDLYDPRAGRVTLMTLHAAKGLEFPVVFIAGCEEGLLPYLRGDEEPDIEEERRLFYVGMTRAQQRLILTHAKSRYLFGQHDHNPPSRFIEDIEQTLKEIETAGRRKPSKEALKNTQLRLF